MIFDFFLARDEADDEVEADRRRLRVELALRPLLADDEARDLERDLDICCGFELDLDLERDFDVARLRVFDATDLLGDLRRCFDDIEVDFDVADG